MKWWKDVKKKFKKELDDEEYAKYEPIMTQLEELNEITQGGSYSEYSEDDLIKKLDEIIKEVSKVPSSVKIDDDDMEITLFEMFDRMINYMKSRIGKKWEEELLQLLKKLRLNRGFSQTELSKLSGVSTSYISRYEKGERHNIGLDKLKAICDALDIQISWLFNQLNGIYTDTKYLKDVDDLLLENQYLHRDNEEMFDEDEKVKLVNLINNIDKLDVSGGNILEKASEILKIVEEYKK